METAPKDGRWFWGLCDHTDAVFMCWHPAFDAFVSGWRRMSMAKGWTINGQSEEDHSPDVCHPSHWTEACLPHEVKSPKPLLPMALTTRTDGD